MCAGGSSYSGRNEFEFEATQRSDGCAEICGPHLHKRWPSRSHLSACRVCRRLRVDETKKKQKFKKRKSKSERRRNGSARRRVLDVAADQEMADRRRPPIRGKFHCWLPDFCFLGPLRHVRQPVGRIAARRIISGSACK